MASSSEQSMRGERAEKPVAGTGSRGTGGPPQGAGGFNIFGPVTDDPSYKWKVLIAVLFGLFMVLLDTTVVNVALKTLQQNFGVSTNESQWVISVYTLALGIATPLSGFLGEKFGIKKIYVGALALFMLGSLLCGLSISLANSLPLLISSRVVQGVGGGLALPLGTAMLFGAFPPSQRGVALGIFGISLVFAPATGPLLGGWLVDHDLLAWIFFINVPIGLLAVGVASNFLRDRKSNRPLKPDVLGIIFSSLGFGSLLYGASLAGEQGGNGWGSPDVIAAFVVGVVSLALFVVVELRSDEPLLDLRLFRIGSFAAANIVGWVGIIALFGAEFLLPLYLQILRGKSAFDTGLFLLPLAITSGIVTPIAGRIADKIGPRLPLVVGFALIAFNTWQLRDIRIDTPLEWLTFLLIIRGIGFGLVIQNSIVAALRDVPGPKTARATSLVNATRQTIQAIGVAALATVLTSALTVNIGAEIQKNLPNPSTLPPQAAAAMQAGMKDFQSQLARGGLPDMSKVPPQMRPAVEGAVHKFEDQYISGLDHAYTATFVVAILATLLAFTLPGWPGEYTSDEDDAPQAAEATTRPAVAAH